MPSRSGKIPAYRLHKPTGQAVVRLDGRDFYLGKHDSAASRERYRKVISEWLAAGSVSPPDAGAGKPPAPSVAEVVLAYWRHAQAHYRRPDGTPSEELANIKGAIKPVRQLYGSTPAREFGPLALRAVRDEMVRSGLARTSVNSRANRVRRMFRWAASVELVPMALVDALSAVGGLQKGRTTAREPDPVGPVALDAVEAVLPLLSRPVAAMVRIQLLTGMRPGEACAMRWRDLDRDGGCWFYRPESHKTSWRGKDRRIALGPRAMEIVEEFRTADPDAYLFDPRRAVADHHAARASARKSRPTPSEVAGRKDRPGSGHSRRYGRCSYRNMVMRACDRAFPHPSIRKARGKPLPESDAAELKAWRDSHRWTPNQLRHTAATEIRARFGLEAAQVVLGHSRADVTQVYAERDLAKAAEVMREVG